MDDTISEDFADQVGPVGRISVRILTAVVIIEAAALSLFSYVTIQHHMNIFKDFGMELPGPTLLVFDGEFAIPVAYCVFAIVAAIKDVVLVRILDRLIVNLLLFVFGFVSILCLWWALYLPMVKLIQGVSG